VGAAGWKSQPPPPLLLARRPSDGAHATQQPPLCAPRCAAAHGGAGTRAKCVSCAFATASAPAVHTHARAVAPTRPRTPPRSRTPTATDRNDTKRCPPPPPRLVSPSGGSPRARAHATDTLRPPRRPGARCPAQHAPARHTAPHARPRHRTGWHKSRAFPCGPPRPARATPSLRNPVHNPHAHNAASPDPAPPRLTETTCTRTSPPPPPCTRSRGTSPWAWSAKRPSGRA
jgi:hypothetical protein